MIKTFSFHSPLSATQLTKVWPLSFIFFFFKSGMSTICDIEPRYHLELGFSFNPMNKT